MRALLFPLAVLLVAGIAVAQTPPATDAAPAPAASLAPTFEPNTGNRRRYPDRALARGQAGIVHLCCSARPNRSLDCRVAFETPQGRGFGVESVRFAEDFRLTEEAFAALEHRPATEFPLAIRYDIAPVPPAQDQLAQQVHEQSRDLCGPGTGIAPPYIAITATRIR